MEKEDPPIVVISYKVTIRHLASLTELTILRLRLGVFYWSQTQEQHIILLDAVRGRWGFPELKSAAHDLWKEFDPDYDFDRTKGIVVCH